MLARSGTEPPGTVGAERAPGLCRVQRDEDQRNTYQRGEELPSIFIKEAKTLKRSMIQNKIFTPTIEFPSPILKGIDALPELKAYVLTSPKERLTTTLSPSEK